MRLRVYHGTRRPREIMATGFRPSTGGEFGPGIYFTERPETASFYAHHVASGTDDPTILTTTVELAFPYTVKKIDWIQKTERRTPGALQRVLRRKGHDGIIGIALNDYERQIIVFDPKSVIGPVEIFDQA